MPRFTLRDVFWCVTLMALGIAGTASVYREGWTSAVGWLACGVLLASGPAIGAGCGALVQQKTVGAVWGGIAVVAWMLLSSTLRISS